MANNSLVLTSLDFDTLKQSFRDFLSSQATFKDYNFDGSNISVLLDVMTYNSYLNSFYLNMVASEMFMDSAQKLDSVISHAKELNYVPRSAISSVATISFTANTQGVASPFVIPKGTTFQGTNANGSYQFVTNQLYNFNSTNSTYTISSLNVYEGNYFTDTFVKDSTNNQILTLSNQNIDMNSLTITVTENGVNTVFQKVSNLFGLDETSSVYFIQGSQDGLYEVLFGDGYLGRIPAAGAIINAEYIVTHGDAGDGISSFLPTTDLGGVNGGIASLSPITVISNSSAGAVPEDIDSIRFSAPRFFATQQRAVAADDYTSLVLDKFGNQLDDVSVYGGETLDNKQYGRVVVSLKPAGGLVAADYIKAQVQSYLTEYVSVPTRVIISDPQYLYLSINSTVQYNTSATTLLPNEITGIIQNNILNYASANLEKFSRDFRYSKFVASIDGSDSSIVSNSTEVNIIKRISPQLNFVTSSIKMDFNNPAEVETPSPGYVRGGKMSDEPVITSSSFTYIDSMGNVYPFCSIRDDNQGNLVIYTTINNVFTIINSSAGQIDYNTGIAYLYNFNTSSYGDYISVYMTPQNSDILINKQNILLVDINDVNINLVPASY